jgi:hypothetical protein
LRDPATKPEVGDDEADAQGDSIGEEGVGRRQTRGYDNDAEQQRDEDLGSVEDSECCLFTKSCTDEPLLYQGYFRFALWQNAIQLFHKSAEQRACVMDCVQQIRLLRVCTDDVGNPAAHGLAIEEQHPTAGDEQEECDEAEQCDLHR